MRSTFSTYGQTNGSRIGLLNNKVVDWSSFLCHSAVLCFKTGLATLDANVVAASLSQEGQMKSLPDIEKLEAFKTSIKSFDFMLCVDLEATCDELMEYEIPRALVVSPDEMETIEIGVAVIDLRRMEIVDMFQRYVRPVLHPTLTDFCINLTSIRQADVDVAQSFPEVATEFTAFLQKYPNSAWGSWGDYDADQLAADALRANCTPLLREVQHLDIERSYREIFACSSMGLRAALEALGLNWKGQYHRGIDDAKNLADMVVLLLARSRETR